MRQLALVAVIALALFGALALPAGSQSPDTLETFVTPEFVSITITGGPVQYGSVPLSTADDNRSMAARGPISVVNNGSVTVDLVIHGSNATSTEPGNTPWTLDCTPTNGQVGQNRFVHKFGKDSVPSTFDFNAFGFLLCPESENAKSLATDMAPEGSIPFVLQISMPTESTGFAERSSPVIVTAVP